MKFYMALNMLDMIGVVSSRLSDVNFPFIILHDPEDGEIAWHCSCIKGGQYDEMQTFGLHVFQHVRHFNFIFYLFQNGILIYIFNLVCKNRPNFKGVKLNNALIRVNAETIFSPGIPGLQLIIIRK